MALPSSTASRSRTTTRPNPLCLGAAVVPGVLVVLALATVGSVVAIAIAAWELRGCFLRRDCAHGWEDAVATVLYVGTVLVVLLGAPILGFRTGRRCWRRLTDTSAAPQHVFYFAVAMAIPTLAGCWLLSNAYVAALAIALALGCGILVLTIKVDDWASSR